LLGRYSYGWYLWHWPPLVLVPLAIGHPLSGRSLVACALLSLACAVVSYHVLEHPVRASRTMAARRGRLSLVVGVVIIALAAAVAQSTRVIASWRTEHAQITTAGGAQVRPSPGVAAGERPQPQQDGCEVSLSASELSPECRYLPDSGRGDIVLVGDSHAVQWFSAVHSVAEKRHWGMRVWTRASCPLADVSKLISGAPSKACDAWRADVMRRLISAGPSLVVVAGYASVVPSLFDRTTSELVKGAASASLYEAGLTEELSRLRAAGIPVLLIRDNPSFVESGPKCVLAHAGSPHDRSAPVGDALRSAADLHAARSVRGVNVLDNTKVFCDRRRCHQVVGSTLAYRDNNHLTIEMVDRLESRLGQAVDAAVAD
jgi:hypothetical protein